MSAIKLIATATVQGIKDKLKSNNIDVSVGTVVSLKNFFVIYATEKEMALCLCKLCLNIQLLYI